MLWATGIALSPSRRHEHHSTKPSINSCPQVGCTSIHAEIKPFHPGTADGTFTKNGKYRECGYPNFKERRIIRTSGRDENMTVPFILSGAGPLATLGWFKQHPKLGNEGAGGVFQVFEPGPPSRNPDYTGRIKESWRGVLIAVAGDTGC